MVLKTLDNVAIPQYIKLLELENKQLLKENEELRSVFNIATDEFHKLRNELSSFKNKYDDALNVISELQKEKSIIEKELSNERAKANKFASMIFGLKSEKIKLSDIIIRKEQIETTETKDEDDNEALNDQYKDKNTKNEAVKKNKGGQVGHKGSGRKIPDNLPIKETIILLLKDEEFYGIPCNEWIPCEGLYEESFIITKEVVWTKIRLLRQRYKAPIGSADNIPKIITAPVPAKIIQKGKYDTSVWVDILNEKYQQHTPIERQVFNAQQAGVNLYCSTVFGGLKNIYETYLEPLYKELVFELQKGERWHADETRWYMLCDQSKKLWYMWGFKTEKITAFVLDATRSACVPAKALLGIDDIKSIKEPVQIPDEKKKILTVDRYSAYKMLERLGFLILSFCWAHQRRDFTDIIKKFPKNNELIKWAEKWLEDIAKLYRINNVRIKHSPVDEIFLEYDTQLNELIAQMKNKIKKQIIIENDKKSELNKNEELDETSRIKLLTMTSMRNHWEGLNIFVDNPSVPMDNNIMENGIRPVALGRNNYIGSQSQWGGDLAACMYSIIQTCKQNNISPKAYLQYFFDNCVNESINKDNPMYKELLNALLPHNLTKKVVAENDLKLKKY
jgi:transposase